MSNSALKGCPVSDIPEYAFIGRSNVGKSSLINMICNRKNLAKTSGTPGKTRLINHFLINKEWYLVDLPGYGYAKVSHTLKSEFSKLITEYVAERDALVLLFVLIDIRLKPQPIDLQFMEMLGEKGIPFHLIFTKTDKLKPTEVVTALEAYKAELRQSWDELPRIFLSSATKRTGADDILECIDALNQEWKTQD